MWQHMLFLLQIFTILWNLIWEHGSIVKNGRMEAVNIMQGKRRGATS